MLSIRNPRAEELARSLAAQRKITMTEAVIEALEHELERLTAKVPLRERITKLVQDRTPPGGFPGRDLTKDEIDEMWGM
jgi:antitoxin VapB